MHKPPTPYAVSIIGARGYSGLELARLLLNHPQARLVSCFGSHSGAASSNSSGTSPWKLSDYLPEAAARDVPVLSLDRIHETAATFETIFLATPAEVSQEWAPKLLALGKNVVDLSGAFRLDAQEFKKWYGLEHEAPALIQGAHYGLQPFAELAPTSTPTLIANPGCFATSILMALLPLLREKLIDTANIVIDSKSGTSGAGRKASENLLFNEVDGECLPYKIGRHQHLPEIVQFAADFAGAEIDPHFTTQLLPFRRGILSCIYARALPGVGITEIEQAFQRHYGAYPLVEFASAEKSPALLSLRRVVGSARTHISFELRDGKLYLFSAIDNLMKGAASQAVENWNRLNGLAAHVGLTQKEGLL